MPPPLPGAGSALFAVTSVPSLSDSVALLKMPPPRTVAVLPLRVQSDRVAVAPENLAPAPSFASLARISAAGQRRRSEAGDAAALAEATQTPQGIVTRDRAVGHGQHPVDEDATAAAVCTVVGDGAAVEHQLVDAGDTPAETVGVVAGYRAVLQRQCPAAIPIAWVPVRNPAAKVLSGSYRVAAGNPVARNSIGTGLITAMRITWESLVSLRTVAPGPSPSPAPIKVMDFWIRMFPVNVPGQMRTVPPAGDASIAAWTVLNVQPLAQTSQTHSPATQISLAAQA